MKVQQSARKLPTVVEILKQSSVKSAPRHIHVCIFCILLSKTNKSVLSLITVIKAQ